MLKKSTCVFETTFVKIIIFNFCILITRIKSGIYASFMRIDLVMFRWTLLRGIHYFCYHVYMFSSSYLGPSFVRVIVFVLDIFEYANIDMIRLVNYKCFIFVLYVSILFSNVMISFNFLMVFEITYKLKWTTLVWISYTFICCFDA